MGQFQVPQALRPPRTSRAEHADYFQAMVEELVQYRKSQNVALEMLAGLVRNHVLGVELLLIPAEGFVQRQWHLPFACVSVTPHGISGIVTIMAGSATSNVPPSNGVGIAQIGLGTGSGQGGANVVNIGGRTLTVYGNPGDKMTLQAFTVPQPPR